MNDSKMNHESLYKGSKKSYKLEPSKNQRTRGTLFTQAPKNDKLCYVGLENTLCTSGPTFWMGIVSDIFRANNHS